MKTCKWRVIAHPAFWEIFIPCEKSKVKIARFTESYSPPARCPYCNEIVEVQQ